MTAGPSDDASDTGTTTATPPAVGAETMRALTIDVARDDWDTTTGFTLDDVARPVINPADARDSHQVVLRVLYAGVCGTDRGIWSRKSFKDMIHGSLAREQHDNYAPGGGPGKPLTSRVIGHEFLGEVVDVGRVARSHWGMTPGRVCASESHVVCGKCHQCRIGDRHVCADDVIIGISRDGCFAEYIKIPAEVLCPVDDVDIRHEVAAVMEPFGNAVHCCQVTDLRAKRVVIFGTGTIGMFAILVARAMGAASVIGVDPNPANAARAKALGADDVIVIDAAAAPPDPDRPYAPDAALVDALRARTDGIGFDVAIEMSGFNRALNNAIQATRRGGDVLLFGLRNADFTLHDYHRVVMNGLTLHGTVGRRLYSTWELTKRLLATIDNGIQERVWSTILNEGEGTVIDLSTFDHDVLEQRFAEHPKLLINPRA